MSGPLGHYLGATRMALGMSLRQVQEKTRNEVSNAYLSQIEQGKVRKRSPNTLHALAIAYDIDYPQLMAIAGHPVPRGAQADWKPRRASALAVLELTEAEEMELLHYLQFMRTRKRA